MLNKLRSIFLILGIVATTIFPKVSYAYPVFAQNAYENPREATGRIVCANCHLAQKPVELEVPQAVLPDTVFEVVVSIPYDTSVKQVTGNGKRGPLNVGSILVLPEGFQLAPKDRLSDEIKAKTKGVFISMEYSCIKRSSDSTSISESVYGALSVNVFKYCKTSSVKSG